MTKHATGMVGFVLTALALAFVSQGLADEPKAKAKGKKEAITWTPEEMKWTETPNSGGVKTVALWGDMNKGAHGTIAKFPAGVEHPLHTHTNDVKLVVITGQFTFGPEGGPVRSFGPGSYVLVPGGMKHTSGCDKSGECTMFQESPGKFDFKPVGAPPAANPSDKAAPKKTSPAKPAEKKPEAK